jgi:hypothetical protein
MPIIEKIVQTAKQIVKAMVESQSARPWWTVREAGDAISSPRENVRGHKWPKPERGELCWDKVAAAFSWDATGAAL